MMHNISQPLRMLSLKLKKIKDTTHRDPSLIIPYPLGLL